MLGKNSIQARLGGVSLMPTIKQFDPGFTNPSDEVTMQKHIGNVAATHDLGVSRLPINLIVDCVVHLLFNLTHDRQNCVDSGSMDQIVGNCKGVCASTSTVPELALQYGILYVRIVK